MSWSNKCARLALVMVCVVYVGCDGDDAEDAGTDAGMGVDAGPDDDAGGPMDAGPGDDAGPGEDAGPPDCTGDGDCGGGETCLRGVCVAHCGADPSGWDGVLAARLSPVASWCRTAGTFDTAPSVDTTTVFELEAMPDSLGTDLTLTRWEAVQDVPPAPTAIGTLMVVHTGMLFEGSYIAASPSGDSVLVGYTLNDMDSTGQAFRVLTADGSSLAVDADGNFDAAWLDDDDVLVNGLMLGALDDGQGLYAGRVGATAIDPTHVATGLGDASGSVAITEDYVIAGGFFFSDFSGRVFAIARSEVEGVIAGTRGAIDFASEGHRVCETCMTMQSSFVLAGDAIVVKRFDAMFLQTGILAFPVTGFDPSSGLALGAEEVLVDDTSFTDAYPAHGGRMLLRFAEGLLLVE